MRQVIAPALRLARQRARQHFIDPSRRRGLLVAFEGPDGSGKTTQRKLFKTWLRSEGYADLFETLQPRMFGEASLFADVVDGGPLDLSRRDSQDTLDRDPALTIIATDHPGVFARHPLPTPLAAAGEFRLNPLYAVEREGERVELRLRFPSGDYEEEYGACRRYLPDALTLDRAVLTALDRGGPWTADLTDLVRRKVILDLPKRYC